DPALDLETVHARHADVEDEAGRLRRRRRVEEVLARAECFGTMAERADQAARRFPYRLVVVDDGDERRITGRSVVCAAPRHGRNVADATTVGAAVSWDRCRPCPSGQVPQACGASSSCPAMRTRSATESASIFSIRCARWNLIVRSLVASSPAICLF